MNINSLISRCSVAVVLVVGSTLAYADNMLFSGTLINPAPCVINGGKIIDVPFGENLGVNKIDGINYTQAVPYSIICETVGSSLELGITVVSASVATFDPAAIQTNVRDLGVRILKNGVSFPLNTRVAYDKNNPPVLKAVPIKATGATLSEGSFEATATLLVDYQ
ncbi:fimbrial family protein [Yersinia rochesterensis]|jgi:type 1 fimbria pilin|uniref:Fimbrial family protein n=1 Tax=Yersinia rochesterensis TaxID=1604335 RepID=A0A386HBU9_9GAMM|nr:fimbrial protein [Yersinia rochesterensis]AJI88363.1 fimbrial family protein [Yersinia frederiksenii Y225]CNH94987.1 minor pili exported protein [Yersinia kristensenii]AIN19851.1 fimbrial family protein [Yersinia rochesterensis]AJJ34897.1 fimbrial family protein [Yersinia rochesterensis]AYD43039.1 pilus assembly protein [Yersinia rochesterensis]